MTLLILGHSQPPHNVVATLINSNEHRYCALPWKPTIEPKVHHQLPYLNSPDQSSKNAQLSHQNHLNVEPTGQNIWLANFHRPKCTTTINIDSHYKSNVATKHPPTTPQTPSPNEQNRIKPHPSLATCNILLFLTIGHMAHTCHKVVTQVLGNKENDI